MDRCYLCGSKELDMVRKEVRHGVQRPVYKCRSCSLVQLEPREVDLNEYYREEYRKTYSPSVEGEMDAEATFNMYLPFMDERVERVRPRMDPSMRILEIGCATGHFLAAMEPVVKDRVGLELNNAHAAFTRKKLGIAVYDHPLEETDCPKHSFDAIFMFHVFEHIPDPRAFAAGLADYLTERGKVYIEVPNIDDALISAYESEGYAAFYYREPHLFYYSPATFTQVMGQAGFQGQIDQVQRYSVANAMHWVTAGTPQPNAEVGMQAPVMASAGRQSSPDAFDSELAEWLARADAEYRALVSRHGRAEAMAFYGAPIGGKDEAPNQR